MRALRVSTLPLLALLTSCAGHPAVSNAEAVPSSSHAIDMLVEAYGGKAALESAHAVRMIGSVVSPSRGKGELVRELEPPDRLRVEVRYAQSREVRLLDGARAFQNGKPASGLGAGAMALQAFRLDLPALLDRMRGQVRSLGPAEQGGVKTLALGLSLEGGKELVAYLDPATWHIVRSETSLGPADERITFVTNYADFRSVNGLLFAFSEENFAGKMPTGQTRLEKIEVLPALPADTWSAER